MIKSYNEYLFEATQDRMGEIKLSTMGGGLKKPFVSFEMNRNPEAKGSLTLELYHKYPREYVVNADPELKAQMDILNGATGTDDEKKKTAEENVQKLIKQKQDDISADFLQLFSQLDEDIKALLQKHNISE
jgi:hypothetical protein